MEARDAVQHMALFRGIDPADADAIAALAEPRTFAPGEELFGPLRPADALFAILVGTVGLTTKETDIPIVTVGSGQSLGDVAFFVRGAYGGSARTRETTSVLRIPFEGIDRLIAERPGLARIFFQNAAHLFAHHLRQLAAERDRPYF